MSSDTDKCPKCGKKVSWSSHGYTCLKCGAWAFNPAKSSDMAELSYPALLHRIRELEARIAAKDESLRFIEQATTTGGVVTHQDSVIRQTVREALKK